MLHTFKKKLKILCLINIFRIGIYCYYPLFLTVRSWSAFSCKLRYVLLLLLLLFISCNGEIKEWHQIMLAVSQRHRSAADKCDMSSAAAAEEEAEV